ncbi:MAG TPA: FG-GAP-like repeat-containing protein [Blastocatellia bacterium]
MKLSPAASLVLLIALGCLALLAVAGKASATRLSQLSQSLSVRAGGRGNPWINLTDGRYVLTSYSGPAALTLALQQNLARPLALASADFDEDGVPDLICGYGHAGSGIISWLRGNVDSIYPNSPEAQRRKIAGEFTDAPFLSPACVVALPIEPEFLGAGDFDGDGHWDVVAASRTSDGLYLLPGDGRGGFKNATRIALPGTVTALVTGEINRRDGLDDIVVAVNGQDGPKALVFEGPAGALRAKPETFDLPAEASALALGQLDEDYPMDLAVAAGQELLIIHGRDRKLSLDEKSRAQVPEASISRRALPFNVRSLAVGDFSGNHATDVALLSEEGAIYLQSRNKQEERSEKQTSGLRDWSSDRLASGEWPQAHHLICARVSGSATDDLLVVDSTNRQLHIVMGKPLDTGTVAESPILTEGILRRGAVSLDVEGEPGAVLPMRLNSDARSSLVVLSSGQPGPSVLLPQVASTFTVTTTSDSGAGSLRQAILAANSNPGTDTIQFNIPGSGVHTIAVASPLPTITDPVIIDGTTQPGFAGTPTIELNGMNASPACPGFQNNAGSTTIRGLVINRFPQDGIVLAKFGENVIEGNFIGTDASGAVSLGNLFTGVGIFRFADNNLVGGTTASARNIISGNHHYGMLISDGATGNQLQGNFVGTDVTGTVKIGNFQAGVVVAFGASNNTTGGTAIGARNLISGNFGPGMALFHSDTMGNKIQNNYIGADVTGAAPLVNGSDGVLVSGARSTSIGDNIISSNGNNGVSLGGFLEITGSTAFGGTGATVRGNFIGTDKTGTIDLGNLRCGIFVENNSVSHTIEDNIIAFNKQIGICVPDNPGDARAAGTPGFSIKMSRNQVFANKMLGIDLGTPGPTPNEPVNPVPGKANLRQNFPVLNNAYSEGGAITVEGTFHSAPNKLFTIEFFSDKAAANPDCRQSRHFMRSIEVNTDANGNVPIKVILPVEIAGGYINATATDPVGNTSEFSDCFQVSAARGPELISITVTSNIVAVGSDFIKPVVVSILDQDNQGNTRELKFSEQAKLKRGTKVVQNGSVILPNGTSISLEEAVPPGKLVQIRFRNGNGAETVVPFKK